MTDSPGRPEPPDWGRLLRQLIPILLVLVGAALGVTIVVVDEDGGGQPEQIIIKVDGGDADTKADDSLAVPPAAAEVAENAEETLENLRDEAPVGVPQADLNNADRVADDLAASDQLPIVSPDAAPEQRGCSSRFVRNYSSRRGVRPRWIVIHYTVSPNLPGVQDLLGLTARANDPASQVSWTYNIDRDGNCFYVVRESDKPWTQATANPFSIGIEIVNSGKESPFLLPGGYKKLGLVISDAAKRWEIPLRRGSVNGCAPGKAGIITHQMLGPCGGGHVDISPFALDPIIRAARAARTPPCGEKCRARRIHAETHRRVRELGCGKARTRRRHPGACKELYRRNDQLHRRYGKSL